MSQPSLSVVLVVHNAEADIHDQVNHLLEIVTDLTDSLNLLILDDGSTDDTMVAASELARRFPQIHVRHNAVRYGASAAARTAVRETAGDYVLLCTGRVRHDQLHSLWNMRDQARFVMAEPVVDGADDQSAAGSPGTVRLLRRKGLRQKTSHGRIVRAEPASTTAKAIPAPQFAIRYVEAAVAE